MEPITAISLALKTGEKGYRVWSWWHKFRSGAVLINHPQNSAVVKPGRVAVEGSHKRAKGHFWLITFAKDQYWLQGEIELRPDGLWQASIYTGPTPGPWACNLLLVRVSDFAHTLFEDIQRRSKKANDFGPVKMNRIPESQFKVVQALVVNVGS